MPETISKTGMCQCGRECELKLERFEFTLDEEFRTRWICDRCHTIRIVVLKPSVQSHLIAAVKEAGVYRPDYYQTEKQIARAIRQNPDAMLDTTNPQPMNPSEFMAAQMRNASASMGVPESMLGQTRPSTASEIQAMQQQRSWLVSNQGTNSIGNISQTPEQVAEAVRHLQQFSESLKPETPKRKERPKNDSITGRKFDLE